jgi:hypothetical protein
LECAFIAAASPSRSPKPHASEKPVAVDQRMFERSGNMQREERHDCPTRDKVDDAKSVLERDVLAGLIGKSIPKNHVG